MMTKKEIRARVLGEIELDENEFEALFDDLETQGMIRSDNQYEPTYLLTKEGREKLVEIIEPDEPEPEPETQEEESGEGKEEEGEEEPGE